MSNTTLLRVYKMWPSLGWSLIYFSTINTMAMNGHLVFRMYIRTESVKFTRKWRVHNLLVSLWNVYKRWRYISPSIKTEKKSYNSNNMCCSSLLHVGVATKLRGMTSSIMTIRIAAIRIDKTHGFFIGRWWFHIWFTRFQSSSCVLLVMIDDELGGWDY